MQRLRAKQKLVEGKRDECTHLGSRPIVTQVPGHRPHYRVRYSKRKPARTPPAHFGRSVSGCSHRKTATAMIAPVSCATRKPGTSLGRMPANVSVIARARVTAGLAKEVDAVNQ